jgi:hypothetical protein
MASNITRSATKPKPLITTPTRIQRVHSEVGRIILDLLVKANVLRKEMMKPSQLIEMLGNPL